MPRRPYILDLDWDDRNVEHVEEHISVALIAELFEGGDWFAFRNYRGHPPEHHVFIGQTPAGLFVTAVLREPDPENPDVWRPITGRLSTPSERRRFQAARQQMRRFHD